MKRFTETTKFDDPWYRKLPPEMKLALEYLYSKCDNAGVIDLDRESAEFHIGASVDWDAFRAACGDRITTLDSGKWLLTKFVSFQFGELGEKSAPHRQVLKLLRGHKLVQHKSSLLVGYLLPTCRVKEKDKDKDKEKDLSRTRGSSLGESFDKFWDAYPRRNGIRKGKSEALAIFKKLSPEDQDVAVKAAHAYGDSGELPKDAHRWLKGDWREWLSESVYEAPTKQRGQDGFKPRVLTSEELKSITVADLQ